MTSSFHLLQDTNLSRAWAHAFLRVLKPGVQVVSPLVVNITNLDDGLAPEIPAVRQALNQSLMAAGESSVHTVANTIFPQA